MQFHTEHKVEQGERNQPGWWARVAGFVLLFMTGLLPCHSFADATYVHEVLLDTDNNATTGCAVTVNELNYTGGPVNGVEYMVIMEVVDTPYPPRVNRVLQYTCNSGVMGSETQIDPGDWNVGLENGAGGADVVEGYVTRAGIGNPSQVKVTFFSSVGVIGGGFSDVMAVPAAITLSDAASSIPTLQEWGLLLLSAMLALAAFYVFRQRVQTLMAVLIAIAAGVGGHQAAEAAVATIVTDGNIGDWSGIAPVATDAAGDSSNGNPNEDILRGFVAWDADKVYFRVDLEGCPAGMVGLPQGGCV